MTSETNIEVNTNIIEIRDHGLVADLFVPVGATPRPAVILVGGSGGGIGWQRYMAERLAERGIVAMALAYFGTEGLAPELERIPLEYFDHALTWVQSQPYVDAGRIGIGGVSKGGELALLHASMHDDYRAVATFVPSAYIFQSIADGFPDSSSWTYRGEDLPFVGYGTVERPRGIGDFYVAGVEQADNLEAATIPVEHINGPVLLLTGTEDTLWPSTSFGDAIVARLDAQGFRHNVTHIAYPDAGHLISSIRDEEEDSTRRGGTAEGNREAQLDGQKRFLDFFAETLKAD